MKLKIAVLAAAVAGLAGCMAPNWSRQIPENKDAHLMIFSPLYGWAVIDTRVATSTNRLAPLEAPPAVPTVTITPTVTK